MWHTDTYHWSSDVVAIWCSKTLILNLSCVFMWPSHFLNQCWCIVNWTLTNKLQWNFNQNSDTSIGENACESENVVCKMALIFFFFFFFFLGGGQCVNSLWPGDTVWQYGTRSILVQVMACCLMAPSHYLNQCWLIIGEVPWHSSQGIILRLCEDTNQ